jgi:tetratricopeptide (TPR) repeat protein
MATESFSAEAVFQQAMQAYQTGQLAEAETQLRTILQHLPDQDGIMTTLGGILLAGGQIQQSIEMLQQALAINASNTDAHLNLGIAHQQLGQSDQAIAAMTQASQLAPQRADIPFNLANVLMHLQQYEEATHLLQTIISEHPMFLSAYHTLGALLQYGGDPEAAIQIYEQALLALPNELQSFILLANLLADTGQTIAAEGVYQRATTAHPAHFLPLAALGKFYLDIGKDQEGEKVLQKAYELHPEDLNVVILLGNVNRTLGRTKAAEEFYRKALKISPGEPGATRNLRRLLSNKIPYWHFEMLADTERNTAYQQAIEKVVTHTSKVLDIGTGSGLLAMMCARAGAAWVTACEMHDYLSATAQEIVTLNGYDNQIKVYNKKSTQLRLGKELPEKVDLIVSEILDVGALGEGVLPSVRQAIQNYAHQNTRLIPAGLQLHAQLIEIPARSKIAPIREVAGFDLSPFEQYRVPNEYLKIILKAEKYQPLSPIQPIMALDFYHLPLAYSDDQPNVTSLHFPITQDGSLQALVFWFDLHLDADISVSSRPDGELEHWGQALFCFPEPQAVKAGQTVQISMLQSDSVIRFRMG